MLQALRTHALRLELCNVTLSGQLRTNIACTGAYEPLYVVSECLQAGVVAALQPQWLHKVITYDGMKGIRHVDSRIHMIILDDHACQHMTCHFQLSLQCNVSFITGFVRHTACPK